MDYTRLHLVPGMKVNLAEVLNHMEDGIANACSAAVEDIGSVITGNEPAVSIRDGKLNMTLPRGDPGPQGDPGEGLSDNAKALLLSLLAGTAPDKDSALAALRAEWGFAEPDGTTTEAADAAEPEA